MKIKVCGMKHPENITALCRLPIDMIGLIFYPPSPRYAGHLDPSALKVPDTVRKVGVFVDESPHEMLATAAKYNLDMLQLHGAESIACCQQLRAHGLEIIKAFGVSHQLPYAQLDAYAAACDYFLFDTRTPQHGGSGQQFNWNLLNDYHLNIPFFLSGGIGLEDAAMISALFHQCNGSYAIDLNSRFETAPGTKDISQIKNFIAALS